MKFSEKEIELTSLSISCNKITWKLKYSKEVEKYFLTDTFFFEYNGDISALDESVLAIPVLSLIMPVAWAIGADVHVNKLDETFLESIKELEKVFMKFYPQFSYSGKLYVNHVVPNRLKSTNRFGMLFSGGVDSLTTYVLHKDEKPALITVWGADIGFDNNRLWKIVLNRISECASNEELPLYTVRMNIRGSLNDFLLEKKFKVARWWTYVAHGLALLGAVSPITSVTSIEKLYISSNISLTAREGEDRYFDGMTPLTSTKISWGGTKVYVEGSELSRTAKIKVLKKYPELLPYLRVCAYTYSKYNCGHCEKCYRTIVALILNNINPSCCFNVDKNILYEIRDALVKRKLHIPNYFWEDIKDHIPEKIIDDPPWL